MNGASVRGASVWGLTRFTNIAVVPVTRVHRHVAHGGPIWPRFQGQTWVRHCRDGVALDDKPELPDLLRPFAGPAIWGGFLDRHFGHFVADHLPRLAVSLRERPDDVVLFTLDPGLTPQGLDDWVWQVFDWIDLRRDRVQFVTEALYVDVLHVASQPEGLSQVPPPTAYLELVEAWARSLVPVPARTLYVGRLGLPQAGGGAHAGEAYLVERLRRVGLAVLDPGTASIGAQMAAYAGAGRLIFAEGSALHGRQLLGRLDQQIEVLLRRPEKVMAKAALTPRCRTLTYHDVSAGRLMAYWISGKPRPATALGLYDVPALWRVFDGWGIDLAAGWDAGAYADAARADVAAWIAAQKPKPRRLAEHRAVLARLGLARS